MFEKEAEEYVCKKNPLVTKEWFIDAFKKYDKGEKVKYLKDCEIAEYEAYIAGAEFGYNKGFEFGVKSNEKVNQIVDNEWHYVKDKLPEKEKYVLVYTELENVYVARLVKDNYFINQNGGFVQTSSVIAWKEIVLPELKESE